MKKRKLLVLFPLATLTLSGCSLADGFNWFDKNIYSPIEGFVEDLFGIDEEEEEKKPGGDEEKDKTVYDFVLEDGVTVAEKETGILHEISVGEVKIDLLGYSEEGGKLGSIKRDSYNGSTFNGMIYNRTLISGVEKLRVDFSGGALQYVFTEFLMEDMDFDSKTNNKLKSGQPVEVPEDACYFVIYNRSTSPVNIDALKLKFREESSFDAKMIYTKDTQRGSARSYGFAKEVGDSFIELESNPTRYTNNYSGSEKHEGHKESDSWYRFNGQYFTDSEDLGNEFTFGMTIAGEYSRFFNEDKLFHYNVWPQFSYGNEDDEPWVQTYIGNDNYDPLGGTPNYSYQGRFYTNYDMYDADWNVNYENPQQWTSYYWTFGDPDQAKIPDGSMTYRQAYNETKLPFWFLKFQVYLKEDPTNDNKIDAFVDIYINGKMIYSTYIFEHYADLEQKPSIHIHTMPMHLINYGNPDGTTGDEFKYTGTFTYPRLIED